jgi:hypothetical protein
MHTNQCSVRYLSTLDTITLKVKTFRDKAMKQSLTILLAIFSLSTVAADLPSNEEVQEKIKKCGEIALVASRALATATVEEIPKLEITEKLSKFKPSNNSERKAFKFAKSVVEHAYRVAETGSTRGFVEFYYDSCLNNFDKFKDI